jgi:hypothetical protein
MPDLQLDYWREALECALDDAGAWGLLTDEQLARAAKSLVISAENEGTSSGHDAIPHPALAEAARRCQSHDAEFAELERKLQQRKAVIARILNMCAEDIAFDRDGSVVRAR